MPTRFSRRAILAQIVGAGAVSSVASSHAFAALDDRPWYFLSNAEARWLAPVVDVFIPEDDHPSASQAGVVDYIDFQMATGYGQGEGLYLQGPFSSEGTPSQGYQLRYTPAELLHLGIAALTEEGDDPAAMENDARAHYVQALSERESDLGDVPAEVFFDELLSLTKEGYFADPIYLGNRDYSGWKMVGFPGAHAYYLQSVDRHNLPYRKPPMGIAHAPDGRSTLPALLNRDG
jgi:hypothetical protein